MYTDYILLSAYRISPTSIIAKRPSLHYNHRQR